MKYVYSVPNYRSKYLSVLKVYGIFIHTFKLILAIMTCYIDSYPPSMIDWVKTKSRYELNSIVLRQTDLQVIDMFTKQIGPTLYETQLTVYEFHFCFHFDLFFECSIIHQKKILLSFSNVVLIIHGWKNIRLLFKWLSLHNQFAYQKSIRRQIQSNLMFNHRQLLVVFLCFTILLNMIRLAFQIHSKQYYFQVEQN